MFDWIMKRIKENVLTWKDKIVYETSVNNHNYGVTLRLMTKKDGQIFFTLNNSDIKELIKQKELDYIQGQKELNEKINNYYNNLSNNDDY